MKTIKKLIKGVLFTVLGLIVLGAVIAIGSDSEETPATETTTEVQSEPKKEEPKKEVVEAKKEEPKKAGIGEKATIADVGFTVQKVEEKTVIESGNQFIDNATTEGKFVILDIKVDNGKKEALTVNSSFFKINFDGAEYEPNTDGKIMMSMGDNMDFLLEQINPNLSKSGKVVFEVPANVDLTKATLHCQTGFWGSETIEINLK